jgi:flagellar hook-associated protein 1 FlgK
MGDGFFGFNVALSGLYSAQRKLNVVNHNLANANTPGFSRQEAIQEASRPMAMYDGTGMVGTGSDIVEVRRIRDEYLDFKYWSENVNFGEWEMKKQTLEDLELIYNEPSESGFNMIIGDFYASLQELAKDPSSSAVRALVRERGSSLSKYFNNVATKFEEMQKDLNYKVNATVLEVNSLGEQIVQINRQIYTSELDGNNANGLRDKRGLLIDKLSRLVNVQVSEIETGTMPDGDPELKMLIRVSGKAFVDHYDLVKFSSTQRATKVNSGDIPNLYDVGWEDGNSLEIRGGELKGYLDIRDGNQGVNNSPTYKGVPYYIEQMDRFVRKFAMAFNEGFIDEDGDGVISASEDYIGHADGYGLDPDRDGKKTSSSEIRFFTMYGSGGENMNSSNFINGQNTSAGIISEYDNMTAKNFAVSWDILNDQNKIATSDEVGAEGNIEALDSILAMRHNSNMYAEGAPEDYLKSLIATLGIDAQQADQIFSNQEVVLKQIDNRRLSESGVSIDEEMANMVKFQHAYTAAAKMINTMSQIYEILINGIGI